METFAAGRGVAGSRLSDSMALVVVVKSFIPSDSEFSIDAGIPLNALHVCS
jgi:hypothetical protein